ncbi:helix-turn-helix domain-containing protein [Pedobacter sp. SYSU D00535]|uniref:helix-turn-helix domain-containing protein n=1 Tax=Pedobacter sp. SYSU D00535 TaxID=2810308 RepID=UPI001A967165|nr:helix-turn-helix transcriptional regulator [Pedobacter sp. SYSU D00535]
MDKPTKEDVYLIFSSNISYLREKHGITQEAFAHQLGISRENLASYEEGRATPHLPVLVSISNKLDYGIDCLLTINIRDIEEVTLFTQK